MGNVAALCMRGKEKETAGSDLSPAFSIPLTPALHNQLDRFYCSPYFDKCKIESAASHHVHWQRPLFRWIWNWSWVSQVSLSDIWDKALWPCQPVGWKERKRLQTQNRTGAQSCCHKNLLKIIKLTLNLMNLYPMQNEILHLEMHRLSLRKWILYMYIFTDTWHVWDHVYQILAWREFLPRSYKPLKIEVNRKCWNTLNDKVAMATI